MTTQEVAPREKRELAQTEERTEAGKFFSPYTDIHETERAVIVRALGDQIAALKREGLTILLSEQNLKFAARLADRAYIIEKGEIRFDGPMTTLMADEALRRKYLTV